MSVGEIEENCESFFQAQKGNSYKYFMSLDMQYVIMYICIGVNKYETFEYHYR